MPPLRIAPAFLLALACAVPAAFAADRAVPAPELAPPPLRLPAPLTRTLANGMRVVVFPAARGPIVQLQLMVPAGHAAASDTLPGVAALTAGLLGHGTTSRTAAQFRTDLSQLGATFATSTDRDVAFVSIGARAGSFESALELMSDAVINPLFAVEDFEQAVRELATRIGGERLNLSDVADARVGEAAFAPHPYAHSPNGDLGSLVETTQERLRAFHRDRWRPDHAVLAIAGDVDPERAFAVAEDWFGRWSGKSAPVAARPAPRRNAGVRVVDVPESRRAEVRVALVAPGAASPEYASWALATAALEGGRLPDGARVTLSPSRDASLLMLSGASAPGDAAALARRLEQSLTALAATPPTGAELDALRRRVAQRYPMRIETLGSFLSQWQANDYVGRPADEIAREGEHVAAADLGPALRAFAARPEVLVVGPAEALREPLAALGTVDVVPLDASHPEAAATLPPVTAEQSRKGRAAIAAAVLAHGGAAKIAAVKSQVAEGQLIVNMDGQDLSGLFSMARLDPERLSYSTRVLKFESRQVLDGDIAWTMTRSDSVGTVQADTSDIVAARLAFYSDLLHQLRFAMAPDADVAARGTELIAGKRCDLVDFATPLGVRGRLAIDPVSHRVLAIDSGLASGPTWLVHRVLSDFRTVNGLLLPFSEERRERGERVALLVTQRAALDVELGESIFARPAALGGGGGNAR